MYKEMISRLLSYPQRGQIKVIFDIKGKVFRLTSLVYQGGDNLPESIKKYIESRKNKTFKPYKTSFHLEENAVTLVQEIPFSLDFQTTLKCEIDQFCQMAKSCHKMLSEMAIEEKFKDAFLY